MKYTAVIAIMDDVPDLAGETLGPDVTLPRHSILVKAAFNTPVGTAYVKKIDNTLVAEFEIDEKIMPLADLFYGVVNGNVLEREGSKICRWSVKEIGLTLNPTDTRLTKLKTVIS